METRTPEATIKLLLGDIPEVMAALTKEYMNNTDVIARYHVRQRIKALLDFMGIDTTFPPNPAVKPADGPQPAREAALMAAPDLRMNDNAVGGFAGHAGFGAYPVTTLPVPEAVPAPGAPRSIDNSDILV